MQFLPVTAGARQLVATLGPTSFDSLPALAEAGATALRINASHMAIHEVRALTERARAALPGVALVIDLQGAKMRLGRFAERDVRAGERLVFTLSGRAADAIPLTHAELFEQTRAGETLSVDDGRLRFRVIGRDSQRLEAEALSSGRLRPRKGVNVVEHPVVLDDLTPADAGVVAALVGIEGLAWAISFMSDGRETAWLRRRVPDGVIVGKIERREAVAHLDALASSCDVLWVCRGDLGAQLGLGDLARFVAALDPRRYARPILMAGQVFESLTEHAEPTRSEACHAFDLLARSYAGFVLSDETAIGVDPVRAVYVAAELMRACG